MNRRTPIHSKWLAQLAKEYPQSADQLSALAEHLFAKQEKLAALIRYCAARPELPMRRMYAEYNAALDAMSLEAPRPMREVSNEEAESLCRLERTARTKRIRTRARIIEAALKLILERPSWRLDELTVEADTGVATIHKYFRTKNGVIAAAYDQLLE